jgi:hypothetical protein
MAADDVPRAAFPSLRSVLLLMSAILLVKACQFGISGVRLSTLHDGNFNPLYAQRDFPMFAWDSFHYRAVVERGYPKPDPGVPSDIAFFPLYPLSARSLGFLGSEAALLVIANLASLAGLVLFYLWAHRAQGPTVARGALILALAYPPAFFLSAAYTEGIFFLLFAATCLLLQQGRLLPAAGCSALASATRPTGIAIAALVVLWAIVHGASSGGRVRRVLQVALVGVISVSGLIVYEAYLVSRYGRWDAYFTAQKAWAPQAPETLAADAALRMDQVQAVPFPQGWRKVFVPASWGKPLSWGIFFLAVAGCFVAPTQLRVFFVVPGLIFLLGWLPDWGHRVSSIPRFETAALPVFLLMASTLPRFRPRLMLGSAALLGGILQAWAVWQFSAGIWCG